MSIDEQKIYSEVDGVLNMLGEKYINKLPSGLYNMIKNGKLNSYNPIYDNNNSLLDQNIKRESLSMIALFHLNYWCIDDKEKSTLKKMLNENEVKYQTYLKEKYNPDDIFKKREKNNERNNTVSIAQYKETIFTKLLNKIKKFLSNKK